MLGEASRPPGGSAGLGTAQGAPHTSDPHAPLSVEQTVIEAQILFWGKKLSLPPKFAIICEAACASAGVGAPPVSNAVQSVMVCPAF